MTDKSQRQKGRDGVTTSLNTAIGALNRAKEATSATPAKAAFASADVLLTMIRDSMINKADYVELGLTCGDICEALSRGTDRRRADQLSQSVLGEIEKLTRTAEEIQRYIIKWGKRNAISRRYHAKDDKEAIVSWRSDLDGILRVFNTELGTNERATVSDTHQNAAGKRTTVSNVHDDSSNTEDIIPDVRHGAPGTNLIVSSVRSDVANTPTVVSDVHCNKLKSHEGVAGRSQATHASAPGESPPPLQRHTYGIDSDIHRDVVNTRTVVNNIHNILKGQEEANSQQLSTQNSAPGELPPPPPRIFFGRDELIEEIVHFAQRLTPIALIGAGGIGKTSIILTILHDDRIKWRFGDNRWFIRCDQFPASHTQFLRQLSKVIGAGIENPEDLTPLRRYLSSKEMFIVLDNAESILDPQGMGAQEIYAVVDELSRFSNVCLCITSRISTIPPDCEAFEIPTLSMEAARDTFYRIYRRGEQSDPINDILEQLGFHPLSVTLLATVAQYNRWDTNRLIREWERRRTGVLDAQHSRSLSTTIEVSLASPMFRELGPDARGLLGIVAFFPQGVNEENVDWLFPTISDGPAVFDKLCILSLTYRSNGFVMMLAPLRDYLCPKDLMSFPLFSTTKERYLSRLSTYVFPGKPGFEESRWITSEDVNVEHLLDVLTSIDAGSKNIWDACASFMNHIHRHKPRLVALGPKIESLPDNHPSKERCLDELSLLFKSVGNPVESERLGTHALKLWRERGDDYQIASILCELSDTNRLMGLYEEGIRRAKEASEIFERLGNTVKQAECLIDLAHALHDDKQLDAAEEAAYRAIDLFPEKGEEFQVCQGHRILGDIYKLKGDMEKAIYHFEVALGIASSFNMIHQSFWVHFALAQLFFGEDRFDDAHAQIERTKSHAINDTYTLGRAMDLQAEFWYYQGMFQKAKIEASHAADVFEKLGAAQDLGRCRKLLQWIDEQMSNLVVSDESDVHVNASISPE